MHRSFAPTRAGSLSLAAAMALLALAGCDGSTSGDDAGVDAGAATDAASPSDGAVVPAAPAPPLLTPCPTGFREVTDDGPIPYCDPWPASGHVDDCAPHEAHFVGEPGCAAVGDACASDGWPAGLPTDRMVVYVAASGARGTGTRDRPYTSLADVPFASLPPGSVVALGVGTHVGNVYATRDVEVVGACAAQTIVRSSGATPGAFLASGATLTVRNLRVSGPPSSSGIDAIMGGALDLAGVVLDDLASAIYVDDTSSLLARDLIVRDLVAGDRWGIYVGGTATITRAVVERAYNDAIQVSGLDARVTVERVSLRETALFADRWGNAITALRGARVEARESAFEENYFYAVASSGAGTDVALSDVVIRETHRTPDGYNGHGLSVDQGGAMTVERVLVDANDGNGLTTSPGGGTFHATDLLVRGGRGTAAPLPLEQQGRHGRGLDVAAGSTATLERVALVDNAEAGLVLVGTGTAVTASDLVIRGSRPRANGSSGRGLNVQDGSSASIVRALIEGNHEVGVFVAAPGSTVALEDTVVASTLSATPESVGRGINAQTGAAITLARVVVRDSREVGVEAVAGASVIGVDVEVRQTLERECVTSSCPSNAAGTSVVAATSGRVDLRGFTIRAGALCGVLVASEGQIDLHQGVVAEHAIGACVQVDGYDIARLTDDVAYVDLGTNLDSTSLPVPEALAP